MAEYCKINATVRWQKYVYPVSDASPGVDTAVDYRLLLRGNYDN